MRSVPAARLGIFWGFLAALLGVLGPIGLLSFPVSWAVCVLWSMLYGVELSCKTISYSDFRFCFILCLFVFRALAFNCDNA